MQYSYYEPLILLSIFVALITSFASLNIFTRINRFQEEKMSRFWLISSAFIMSVGTWTMHFIGMLSFDMHIPVTYGLGLNILSLFLAFIGFLLTFYMVVHIKRNVYSFLTATFIMTISYLSIHLLGMKSMSVEMDLKYDVFHLTFSMFLAVFVSAISLILFIDFFHRKKNMIVDALFIGMGMFAGYYAAMEAIILEVIEVPDEHDHVTRFKYFSHFISTDTLGYGLGFSTIFIIVTIIALAYFDKHKAERLRKLSENHCRSLVDHNPNLVFAIDKDGTIQNVNPKGLEILKGSKEQIVSKSLFSFFHDKGREKLKLHFLNFHNDQRKDFESSIQALDGKWIPMDISLVPIIVDGKQSGVFVIARDNTEVVEQRERVKKAQRELQQTIKRQQGLIFKFVKVRDRFIYTLCEGELLYNLGLRPNLILGNDPRDFLPLEIANQFIEEYKKAWNGEVVHYEGSRNGIDYFVVLNPVIEQGKIIEVIGSGVDITLLKENEIQLKESHALRRTMIDSLPIGMVVVDKVHNIIALNNTFCKIFNINEPIPNIIGKSVIPYRNSLFKDREREWSRVHHNSSYKQPIVMVLETVDQRIMESSNFPFFMDGKLKGHLWTFEDITKRKNMELSVVHAKEAAIKANLAKSQFLSNMSHELRTPLNGILGFSQLLELDSTLNEGQQSFIQEILKGGRHLLGLINEILDLSRIETGTIKLSKETVQIGTILEESINLVRPNAYQKGITILENLNDYVDTYVQVDKTKLRQVIFNLLENAIKYNQEQGHVMINCQGKDDFLYVHVRDTGIGIPIDEQTRIFEPFYRRDHAHIEGTGIGLSLVSQIIPLMGGQVGVTSKEGEGSDFWFSLPIQSADIVKMRPLMEDHQDILPKNHHSHILYIEDNPSNLQLVTAIFESQKNISLTTASTGKEGLRIAREEQVDLILLDINLPDLSGFEVLQLLKSNIKTTQIPVFAVSANAMINDIKRALDKGFNEYITKPIEIPSLLMTISKYL